MLEVCPLIATDKPKLEVHFLGIGIRKSQTARLVFTSKTGKGVKATVVDLGNRFRLIASEVECIEPKAMPKLPVASALWVPQPSFEVGAGAWILAGGTHHSAFSYDITAEYWEDFCEILGIEFGSTRIKAVLIDEHNAPIAQGAHEWENRYEGKIWTYSINDIWNGLQDCYADLRKNVKEQYGEEITELAGIGDASGMLPIDSTTNDYDATMVEKFDNLIASKNLGWKILDILPKVLLAGENAGNLTEEGAKLLDPSGNLQAGAPLCPPEGDAGTGMVATNAVRKRTGNVSAGTSSFSMIVLEKALSRPYEAIDMVTTPCGSPVAMVHCNNCTSDLNAWVSLFKEYANLLGVDVNMGDVFSKLYNHALEGDTDCGGLIAYNYFSGEPITGLQEGRPMFVRTAGDKFNLANFICTNLYAAVAVLKIGNDVLFKDEHVEVDRITGHGGLFKTPGVGQRILAAAINSPISVMETAGEGGAWGIALLAGYMVNNKDNESLADYLDKHVFAGNKGVEIAPTAEEVAGFDTYIESYKAGLAIEQAAVANKK